MLLVVAVVILVLMIDDIAILLHLDYELLVVVHDDENTHDLEEVAHAVVAVDNIDQKKISNHEDNLDDVPSCIEEVLREDAVVDILVDNDDFVESPTEVEIDTCHIVDKEVVVHERKVDMDLADHIDDDVLQDIHNVDLDDDNSYDEEVHH